MSRGQWIRTPLYSTKPGTRTHTGGGHSRFWKDRQRFWGRADWCDKGLSELQGWHGSVCGVCMCVVQRNPEYGTSFGKAFILEKSCPTMPLSKDQSKRWTEGKGWPRKRLKKHRNEQKGARAWWRGRWPNQPFRAGKRWATGNEWYSCSERSKVLQTSQRRRGKKPQQLSRKKRTNLICSLSWSLRFNW